MPSSCAASACCATRICRRFRARGRAGSRDGNQLHDFLDKNHIPHRLIAVGKRGRPGALRAPAPGQPRPAGVDRRQWLAAAPALPARGGAGGGLAAAARRARTRPKSFAIWPSSAPVRPVWPRRSMRLRKGLKTVVLESYAPGGQAGSSSLIENFFGFPTGISGGDLTHRAQLQAFRFGAKFSTPVAGALARLSRGRHMAPRCRVEGCPATLRAKCVIIATGAEYRRIEAEGREDFEGLGRLLCRDGAWKAQLCRGATVIVAGGGNSAGQAAMFLSECAAKVLARRSAATILPRACRATFRGGWRRSRISRSCATRRSAR